jgi:ribose-phosphate pyrophosphokinase
MVRGNPEMRLLTGTAHPQLAKAIAEYIGVPLGDATVSSFPDGETFVKINENVRGRDVFIIQPTCPPTNQNLMELLILVDAARRASAARITAVIPFFGYARQDRKDQPRVPITAKLVANLLVAAGVNRLLTMDLHAQQLQGFFDIPVDHLHALPVLIKYLQQKNIPDLVVVSPDVGGVKMASAYAQVLGAGLAIVVKRRISATETEAQHVIGDVKRAPRTSTPWFPMPCLSTSRPSACASPTSRNLWPRTVFRCRNSMAAPFPSVRWPACWVRGSNASTMTNR